VAHDVTDGGHEMRGGKPVLRRDGGVRAAPAHHGGIDDKALRARGHDAFDAAAALALLDEMDQAGDLEGAQVVVDALAAEGELAGECGRGGGLAEPLEEAAADGGEGEADVVGLVEQHGATLDWENKFVKWSAPPATGCMS
jgi:hypothetical protein